MEFVTGLFKNISNRDYHNSQGYSRSDLVLAKDYSPTHVKAKEDLKETPAMIFGSAAHMACLEPDLFPEKYSVMPAGLNFRTKDGKAFKEMAEEKGKICLSASDGENIFAMQKKILEHPLASRYLNNGDFELSGFFMDIDFNLPCKVRYDYYLPNAKNGPTIIDYKTARDARERPFTNAAYNSRYNVQAAWYSYGLSCITEINFFDVTFIFIVQEKEPPYEIMVYQAEEDFKREGMFFCNQALEIIAECENSGNWPGYDPSVTPLELPDWVKRQHERGIYE